jgi:hypothetical protein
METTTADTIREPWNKGKLVGQKTPFKLNPATERSDVATT